MSERPDGGRKKISGKRKCCLPPERPPQAQPNCSKRSRKKIKKPQDFLRLRAEDEARTRDNQLGRLELYQLSYFRLNADANIRQVSCDANFFLKMMRFGGMDLSGGILGLFVVFP